MYHEIASALRHEYVLGIAPAHDGQFHALTVEVLDANGRPMNAPAGKRRDSRSRPRRISSPGAVTRILSGRNLEERGEAR